MNVILELIFKQLLTIDKTDPLLLHRRLQLSSISESQRKLVDKNLGVVKVMVIKLVDKMVSPLVKSFLCSRTFVLLCLSAYPKKDEEYSGHNRKERKTSPKCVLLLSKHREVKSLVIDDRLHSVSRW